MSSRCEATKLSYSKRAERPGQKRKLKKNVQRKIVLTNNDNNSFAQTTDRKLDALNSDEECSSMDQSSCTTRFMNLTLTERKNDRSFVQPVSN